MSGKSNYSSLSARAKLGVDDWIKLLMRELWLMIAIFSIISVLGVSYAMTLKKNYTAEARLSVLLGDEYVYSPTIGASGAGSSPKQEQILQSEVEILTSSQVAERVVRALGLNYLFEPKDIVVTSGPNTEENRFNLGVASLRKNFGASTTPNTTVIYLSMKNKNPVVAAKSLDTLINQYLEYRRQVLFEDRSKALEFQADDFKKQLDIINAELAQFLKTNNITDFDAERTSLQTILSATRQEYLTTQNKLSEAEGRYSATNKSYANIPNKVQLSFETDISKRKVELQQQLAELLTKYKEDSQPVRDLREKIRAVDAVLNSSQGQKAGTVRYGTNPVHDSLATDAARANAEVMANVDRQKNVKNQLASLEQRSAKIESIKPQYDDLVRKKSILEDQVKDFTTKAATAKAQTELYNSSNDNIRVIERPIVPTSGKSMKALVALASIMFAGFTALVAGALRVLTKSNFPTVSSVSRTLGLPILATINKNYR